jgi:lipopolysaccharide/colanic/teichoic acid biosynthesis glycosyltransferase
MSVRPSRLRPLDLKIKRVFDILVSSSGLLFVSPILIWAALRIKFGSKGPVFFRQQRCGFDGQPFEVLKFRTMVDGADNQRGKLRERAQDERGGDILFKLEDDPRVTAIGKTLRKWSIDELPQLWNVLKGEMSIVGPRPLPYDEADQATGMFSARNRVKPGLAGPWQANGRSVIPFADMIRLDYSYAVGWSLTEDIKLLFRTVVAVFSRRGAY